MPELPEVHTVCETLRPRVKDKKIASVDVFYPPMIKRQSAKEFEQELIGKTFNDIKRRGKYILFVIDDLVLVSHLRMEGKYYLKTTKDAKMKHEHCRFNFTDGTSLSYHDVRKFGTMHLTTIGALHNEPPLSLLGPEPFDEMFTPGYLYEALKRTKRPIKSALLDQRIILGLGNIYVDETLFCARLHPEKRADLISRSDASKLVDCAKKIITKAIALGGTSIRTYTDSLGISGRFQNELNVHTKTECPLCLGALVKIKVGGRGTYYCPTCQSKRRKKV